MRRQSPGESSDRALIIIPGTVNYFYNLNGRRIAEALQGLGFAVDVCTLSDCPSGEYEWCLISNITEVAHAFGDEAAGIKRIQQLRQQCNFMACCAIDCVQTHWYRCLHHRCEEAGIHTILDLGFFDQGHLLDPYYQAKYRFVFSGLTPNERAFLDTMTLDDHERRIPWAFVGHSTIHRAALVDYLIQRLDPRGLVYMPTLAPYTETGSPHLNQKQFEAVLQRSRYQIWCSHHEHFYMEPERFRSSLLTGSVPVKVVDSTQQIPGTVPFRNLMMTASELATRLRADDFAEVRMQFTNDWKQCPTLQDELSRFLGQSRNEPKLRFCQAA